MSRADLPGIVVSLRRAIILCCLFVAPIVGCGAGEAPEPLVELRRSLSGPSIEPGRAAAPDLLVEAERSLENAESAQRRGDLRRARWLAELGLIQTRTAMAIARRQSAAERQAAAERATLEAEAELGRYRSQRAEALEEIQRLEQIEGAAQEPAPSPAP